ncbi:MAG: gliding motility-associated C-terminal domain-containing protein [Bacteroidia bacterium]|nr:gliding motility-associated C-terminal domain-containing protein [Bacteroidia bacterium]
MKSPGRFKYALLALCLLLCCGASQLFAQTFLHTYGKPGINEGACTIVLAPDGNFFVGGYQGDSALIMKMTPSGSFLWARSYKFTAASDAIFDLEITRDSFLIGAGNGITSILNQQGFAFKMDLNGNLIWANAENSGSVFKYYKLLEGKANEYILVGNRLNSNTDGLLIRMDAATGNPTTTLPIYGYTTYTSEDAFIGPLIYQNRLYIAGRSYIQAGSFSAMRGRVSKFDLNGSQLYTRQYTYGPASTVRLYTSSVLGDGDSLVMTQWGNYSGTSQNFSVGFFKTDTLGTIGWSKMLDLTGYSQELFRNVTSVPNGYLFSGHTQAPNFDLIMVRTDQQGNVLWANAYGGPDTDQLVLNAKDNVIYHQGSIYLVGESNSYNPGSDLDILIMKTDPNGNGTCVSPTPLNYSLTSIPNPYDGSHPFLTKFNGLTQLVSAPVPIPYPLTGGFSAGFTADTVCAGSATSFTDTSVNATGFSYFWDFENDNSFDDFTAGNTSHTYPGPGTYTAMLVVEDTCGNRDTAYQTVLVNVCTNIINIYTPVSAINGCNQVTVGSSAGFFVGGKVMIIQMKGASVNLTNTAAFGSITSYNEAGDHEFATVAGISGNVITLQNGLLNTYNPAGTVQLLTVPTFANLTLNTPLTAQAWNGSTGGILAFEVSGTLTLNADLDVSGLGFRGANRVNIAGGCSQTGFFYNNVSLDGAIKGEGIVNLGTAFERGRGAQANGGGGGNTHNSGGAGGSNFGAGGQGGNEYTGCASIVNGGLGGFALNYVGSNKIFLGGGGGAGHENNNNGREGEDGGGIVALRAGTVIGNGHLIRADGNNNVLVSGNDGAGGGGAGGTLVLEVSNFVGALNLRADGGDGGNTNYTPTCVGPGGGGGAGVVLHSGAVLPGGVVTSLAGGQPGLHIAAGSSCFNSSYGATAGANGVTLGNRNIPESNSPIPTVSLGNDTTLCAPNSVLLDAGNPGATYLWSTGATTQTLNVSVSGTYYVDITDTLGCTASDTIVVTINPLPVVTLTPDTTICEGDVLQLNATGGSTYLWTPGTALSATNIANPVATPVTSVSYQVLVTTPQGCQDSATVNVTVTPLAACPVPVSGIINIYTPVASVDSCNSITVGSSAGFNVGDKVLIIQMKGATTDLTNTGTYGTVTAYNDAGNYEFATISAISGNSINFQFTLLRTYDPTGLVQMVSVPQYNNITVTAPLTAQAWNGSTGGVLVFEATGTVTLQADLNVDGTGFRGGNRSVNFYSGCSSTGYFYTFASGLGAQKGEGITDAGVNHDAGQGSRANGGGGANHVNSGGGGGGNFGLGGEGGNQWGGCPVIAIGGDGGKAQTYNNVLNKVFMGGGGGGGHQNNNNSTSGTNGGGLIIFRAGSLDGQGFQISADGLDQTALGSNDGAGGGGAGGAILAEVGAYASPVTFTADGGDGGDLLAASHGPGGGGAGGAIWYSGGALPGTVTVTVAGGAAGQDAAASPWGALPGAAGGSIANLVIPESNNIPVPLNINLGNDTTLCAGDSITYDAGYPGSNYVWSTGATTQTITTDTAGTYIVNVSQANGCAYTDTVMVSISPNPVVNLGNDTSLCAGDSVLLDAGNPGLTYLWSTGATSQTLTAGGTGFIWVDVTNANGCTTRDSIQLTTLPYPVVNLGNDTSLCAGDSLLLDAGNPGFTYTWSTGATTQTITAGGSATFWVDVSNSIGCTTRDSITLLTFPYPIVNLGNDTSLCAGDSVLLDAGNPGFTYLWSTGATSQSIIAGGTGPVWVDVSNSIGCTTRDSIVLTTTPNPVVFLGNDTIACPADSLLLDAGNPGFTYLWSNNAVTQTILVPAPGTFWVEVTNPVTGCSTRDTITLALTPNPVVNLGNDTVFCVGQSVVLNAGNAGSTYLWSDNSTAQTLTVTGVGTVWVQVTNPLGCVSSDTINLNVAGYPLVDLGPDTILCFGQSLFLDASNVGGTYLWFNGATAQTQTFTGTKTIWVAVTNPTGCTSRDTLQLTTLSFLGVNLGNDRNLCEGTPLTLDAGNPGMLYQWSTNEATQTISVSASGTYWVVVSHPLGCPNSDTVQVNFALRPVVDLGPDTVVCDQEFLALDADPLGQFPNATYTWSNGDTGPAILIDANGNYWVKAVSIPGCFGRDTLGVTFSRVPVVELGPDTTLCGKVDFTLDADPLGLFPGAQYLWNTNESTPQIQPLETGLYQVWVQNECGIGSDSIGVEVFPTARGPFVPNAFSPNGDGTNDLFLPVAPNVMGYSLQIFDRWGQLIFQSTTPTQGWDGTHGGKAVPEGVYVYRLRATDCTGDLQDRGGSVTLIR